MLNLKCIKSIWREVKRVKMIFKRKHIEKEKEYTYNLIMQLCVCVCV